jgi:hypothetical protein
MEEDARIAHILEKLERTERYISVAKEHVALQWVRVAVGAPAPLSTALLHSFEESLRSFMSHRDLLKHELSVARAEAD